MSLAFPICIEQTFKVPAARIWCALSNKSEMKKWYFNLADFRAEPGFEFQFEGGDGTRKFLHLCRVTEAVAKKKLAYTWRYAGFAGNSLVTFELFPSGTATRLKLTHTGLETFPETEPALARSQFEAGWNQIIGTSLKNYLESKDAPATF